LLKSGKKQGGVKMARVKKSKARTEYVEPIEMVRENGVEVSREGRDHGPAHLWKNDRNKAEELYIEEIQIAVAGKKTRTARRVDCLERLLRDEDIDRRRYDAGKLFEADFYKGHLVGYAPPKLEWTPPTTGDKEEGLKPERARQRVSDIMAELRAKHKVMADAAWEILGNSKSLRELGKGSRDAEIRWEAYLIVSLSIIADYYSPPTKKRS
jgi:hypothetical protein